MLCCAVCSMTDVHHQSPAGLLCCTNSLLFSPLSVTPPSLWDAHAGPVLSPAVSSTQTALSCVDWCVDTPPCVFLLAFLKNSQRTSAAASICKRLVEWVYYGGGNRISLHNNHYVTVLPCCLWTHTANSTSCCCRALLLTDVCLQDGFRQKMKRRLFDSKTVLMPSAETRGVWMQNERGTDESHQPLLSSFQM